MARRRRRPGHRRRHRAVERPGRDHRRPDLLRHHHADGHPARVVRGVRGVGRRPRHLGRHRPGHRGRPVAAAPPRREHGPVHGRGGPRPAGGAGHRADRQLLQQGTLRPPDLAALGPGHPLPVPAVRRDPREVPERQRVPADLPVRADLRLRLGRRAGLAGSPRPARPQDQAARPVRAVRVRLFRVPDLRGVAAHRLLGLLPRPAPEHLHRLGPGRDRPALVLAQPAPPGPRARPRPRARGSRRALRPRRALQSCRGARARPRARRCPRVRRGRSVY